MRGRIPTKCLHGERRKEGQNKNNESILMFHVNIGRLPHARGIYSTTETEREKKIYIYAFIYIYVSIYIYRYGHMFPCEWVLFATYADIIMRHLL